ncbi:uncharacterized protein LOC126895096 isoform X2 [Daktulosphaira vitifoliae]|uniref:uncharacterized protein LOC126895096 isoform X2 n=1 Tax=Daktulosphaira vitifoliae TaxID=58002 RepID=UPI0021AAA25A|nr:uncharacterized protein LOC126895096 isoform X2 [Daktulosphaira vitifoliae]
MNMKFFFYVLFSLMILNNHYFVHCKIKPSEYKIYVINVLNHLCNQQGWKLMPHILVNTGNLRGYPIHTVLNNETTRKDYIQVLHLIIYSINYRYTEILWYFNTMITYIIDKCNFYLKELNTTNFNNCTILLYDTVKNSANMFSKLFNAMMFISQINLKNIKINMESPSTIIDYIKPFNEFTNLKLNKNSSELLGSSDHDILQEFKNVISFFKNIKEINIIQKLINGLSMFLFINKNHVPQYLQIMYEEEALNKFKKSNLDDSIIKNLLINFYDQTIKNDYENIGFVELLDPNKTKFRTPDEDIVIFLSSIIKKNGWNNLNHITIKEKDNCIKISDIVSYVSLNNYIIIRKYLSKLMRCRYTEILHNFDDMLNSLIFICKVEQNNNNTISFIHCVIQIYDIINRSTIMFDRLSFALSTIRRATNHFRTKNHQLVVEKLVDDLSKFFKGLLMIYHSQIVFIDLNDTYDIVMIITMQKIAG